MKIYVADLTFDILCPECKRNVGPLFVIKHRKLLISGKLAFHLQDTHGIMVEMLSDMVINALNERKYEERNVS